MNQTSHYQTVTQSALLAEVSACIKEKTPDYWWNLAIDWHYFYAASAAADRVNYNGSTPGNVQISCWFVERSRVTAVSWSDGINGFVRISMHDKCLGKEINEGQMGM